jgi:hypothetical protein
MSLPAPEHTCVQYRQHRQQLPAASSGREINDMLVTLGENRACRKILIELFFASIQITFCILQPGNGAIPRMELKG